MMFGRAAAAAVVAAAAAPQRKGRRMSYYQQRAILKVLNSLLKYTWQVLPLIINTTKVDGGLEVCAVSKLSHPNKSRY
jgi:hypothetical protein